MTGSTGWDTSAPVASVATMAGEVTLVEGQTFCVSTSTGAMRPEVPQGLFFLDTRILSRFELRLNDHEPETLAVTVEEPFSATFVCLAPPAPGLADACVVMFRYRHIGNGMRERLVITNHGQEPAPVTLEMRFDADFAGLFDVKESRVHRHGHYSQGAQDRGLVFEHRDQAGRSRKVHIQFSESGDLEPTRAVFHRVLEPREVWEICLDLRVVLDGTPVPPRFSCGKSDEVALPGDRLASWRARFPAVDTDNVAFSGALARSREDLGALRIFDPEFPEVPILAAGAPWFMTVFGRDSLLTGWMTLPGDPSLALGVLQTLARFQGTKVHDKTEEEPGKILHEMRFGGAGGLALGGGDIYYGSIDSTPLFVMLMGEVRRWGAPKEETDRLLPHADRALEWIERFGDRDGDGYVEYLKQSPDGLSNQGWKDSWDGVRYADGRPAEAPIALCEVQGYVYAAYIARAHFAQEAGDFDTCERYRSKAAELRRRFNEDFWMPDQGTFALGLDADKNQIDAVASNVGHCLWTGIVDPEKAGLVADRLLGDDMFSGWGVRTLSTAMAAYNPVSYHNGSVWPHDNALCAAGLARYGFVEHAQRIIEGQIDASMLDNGRIPELFAGFSRDEVGVPAAYPASCSPQAWGAAAPLSWLRTLLRLDPWMSRSKLWIAPMLPESIERLNVEGIQLGDKTVSITAISTEATVCGMGDIEVVHGLRSRFVVPELCEPGD